MVGVESGHAHQALNDVQSIERIGWFFQAAATEKRRMVLNIFFGTQKVAIQRDHNVGLVELEVRLNGLAKCLGSNDDGPPDPVGSWQCCACGSLERIEFCSLRARGRVLRLEQEA